MECGKGFTPRFLGTPINFWHEQAAFQRSAFGRSTAGNDVVSTKNAILFFFFSFFFSPLSSNYFGNNDLARNKENKEQN